MDRLYLDTNCFIDLLEMRDVSYFPKIIGSTLITSILSLHIVHYLHKYKVPEKKALTLERWCTVVEVSYQIGIRAIEGPTKDYEDNIHLLTALDYQCPLFLTRDKKLLRMKQYETMDIVSPEKLR